MKKVPFVTLEKAKEITEDQLRDVEEETQKLTDKYVAEVDAKCESKSSEEHTGNNHQYRFCTSRKCRAKRGKYTCKHLGKTECGNALGTDFIQTDFF
jgi:hypothetical protein